MECGDSSPLDAKGGDESPHSTTSGLQPTQLRNISYLILLGFPLKAGQLKVKPFVVSPELVEGSNHERLNRPPFDKLMANG